MYEIQMPTPALLKSRIWSTVELGKYEFRLTGKILLLQHLIYHKSENLCSYLKSEKWDQNQDCFVGYRLLIRYNRDIVITTFHTDYEWLAKYCRYNLDLLEEWKFMHLHEIWEPKNQDWFVCYRLLIRYNRGIVKTKFHVKAESTVSK